MDFSSSDGCGCCSSRSIRGLPNVDWFDFKFELNCGLAERELLVFSLDSFGMTISTAESDILDNGDEVVFCSTEDTLDNGDEVVFCSIAIVVVLWFEPGRIVCNGSCLDVDPKDVVFFCITGNKEEFLE